MRRNNIAPRTRGSDGRGRQQLPQRQQQAPAVAARKVFNCIVDDSALVAGVKHSTRDGIRKWVAQDAIRLFVPLQTLDQLRSHARGKDRFNADARDAVIWLDQVTEDAELAGRVQIECPDEQYPTWDAVEQFLLPGTLLSIDDVASDDDDDESDYADELEDSFAQLEVSDGTSVSSSHSLEDGLKTLSPGRNAKVENAPRRDTPVATSPSPSRTARTPAALSRPKKLDKNSGAVPAHLKPLFNHVLWRINCENDPGAALESFILLTNDAEKQAIAQKFGIRTRRLEQLREAVAREDREYRNHQMLSKIESGALNKSVTSDGAPAEKKAVSRPTSSQSQNEPASDNEDVVLFNGSPRGPAAHNATNNQRVFDPNDFGRSGNHKNVPTGNNIRGGRGAPHARGGFVAPPRGRGVSASRGRGGFVPRGAYMPPAQSIPSAPSARPAPAQDANGLLNPDSYERPAPRVTNLRGGHRKLWEPN